MAKALASEPCSKRVFSSSAATPVKPLVDSHWEFILMLPSCHKDRSTLSKTPRLFFCFTAFTIVLIHALVLSFNANHNANSFVFLYVIQFLKDYSICPISNFSIQPKIVQNRAPNSSCGSAVDKSYIGND